ncbi:hypothetical protein [Halonatronum saccharophilum]|uniref:hypothetical protein n=1 Tax=Halonatronum saccharophilum TaxID=150060 RepID=UPI0004802780|nr:hypothetical protein [Halonatronum saccharophilum]
MVKIKLKNLLIGFVILVISVIMVNSYLGSIAERRIEEVLNYELDKDGLGVEVEYNSLAVNPLLAQVKYEGVEFFDQESGVTLRANELRSNLSYGNLIKMIRSNKFNKVEKFKVDLKDLEIKSLEDDYVLFLEEFKLYFDGKVLLGESIEDFEIPLITDQSLSVNFSNLDFEFSQVYEELGLTLELEEKLRRVDSFNLKWSYDSDKKELSIDELNILAPLFSFSTSSTLRSEGWEVDTFEGFNYITKNKFKFDGKDFYLGDPELTGKYNLDKLLITSELEGEVDEEGLFNMPKGEAEFLLEGFKVQFPDALREELSYNPIFFMAGIDIDEFVLNQLKLSYVYEDNLIKLTSGVVDTDIVIANLEGQFSTYNNEFLGLYSDLYIDKFKIRITELNDQLAAGLMFIEFQMGQPLPRDGEDIIIKIEGPFNNPSFIGLPF